MVMRAHHDKESEEEDEDSGHDQLDVSAGDLMMMINIIIIIIQPAREARGPEGPAR